jgi:glucose-6-phosphate 1-dehydrogenase
MPERETVTGSTVLVIFGITGDLAHRKLLPALYELTLAERLPENFSVIGFARRDWSDDYLRQQMRSSILEFARSQPIDQSVLDRLLSKMFYVRSSFDESVGYQCLDATIARIRSSCSV